MPERSPVKKQISMDTSAAGQNGITADSGCAVFVGDVRPAFTRLADKFSKVAPSPLFP